MRIVIDATQHIARADSHLYVGKWADMIALLALARVDPERGDRPVAREEVHRLIQWAATYRSPLEVGKVVAAEIDRAVKEEGASPLSFEPKAKTKAWRLAVSPEEIDFLSDRETVRRWVEHELPAEILDEHLTAMRELIEAAIALQHGEPTRALELASRYRGWADGADPWNLGAWATLLVAQAAERSSGRKLVAELKRDWPSWRTDSVGRAVRARLAALSAFMYRFTPEMEEEDLVHHEGMLKESGDTGTLATLWNVHGILARRAGRSGQGAVYHLHAIPIFGIHGHFAQLQGAVFNLALCYLWPLPRDARPPDLVMELIDLAVHVCAAFNLGRDSAQAEVTGARLADRRGEHQRAGAYLKAAEAILRHVDNTFDKACFHRARAHHRHAVQHCSAQEWGEELRLAAELFRQAGDQEAWRDTLNEAQGA
ncbi:MAG: hypothetical protein ACOZNI_35330 [Myxococcota bacterium]